MPYDNHGVVNWFDVVHKFVTFQAGVFHDSSDHRDDVCDCEVDHIPL